MNRGRSLCNLLLSLFCFSLGWWLLGYSFMYFSWNDEKALFWARFGCMGIVVIPVFTFHFILELLNKKKIGLTIFFYVTAACLLPLVWSPLVYKRISNHFWGYYPSAGQLYWLLLASFLITFLTGAIFLLAELIKLRKIKSERQQFKRVQFVFFGILAGCFGVVDYVIKYGIEVYPFGYIAAFVFASLIVYAIFRHKLLNIQLIIKRTIVFAGLLALVFGIYTFATLFIRTVLSGFFVVNEFWQNALAIGLIVVGYDPLRAYLINLTDKYLFQKAYNYHQVLKDASRGMAKIESLKHLLGLVLHFVTMKMRVENASVLSYDTNDRLFRLVAARGYKGPTPRISLHMDHPMMMALNTEREALQVEELTAEMQSEKPEIASKEDLKIILDEMQTLDAKCAIPSFLGRELRNVLLIGDKKSGEGYTTEDISLLMTLAQESSIAIENARLYDEAIKKQKQLGQINDQLEHSKKMLVQALAQAEGANKQLQDTQAQLIHEQKMATLGRLAASVGHEVNNPLTILSMNVSRAILKFRKNPDLKVNEILDVFDKMEKNIERIKAVVNTLTGLLKKSEKGKFEPLSLKLILEETLPLVQFQTYMDNLTGTEVELNVPGSVPLIRGDLERLQEIFLNLFINAYHAMAGKRFRKIRVDAEPDSEEPGMVAIHFTDNGSGMSEETMKKIFNYGYTTKPPGKGSGMGLYMCKYIVELHGGTIRVKSKLGEGTTFTVTLPAYKDEPTAASTSTKQNAPGTDNSSSSSASVA